MASTATVTNEGFALQNVELMLKQQIRVSKAAAKVYNDPIARAEAQILEALLASLRAAK